MYVKKIKRKCGVRGCKNTTSYAISKTREMGNSIIVCKQCLLEALNAIEEKEKPIEEFEEAPAIEEKPIVEETKAEEAPTETEKPRQTRQRKK